MSDAYKTYQPGADFLNIPIWISGGMDDSIATPSSEGAVQASLQRAGFKRVRVERFMGGHRLKRSEVRLALRWFRELGGILRKTGLPCPITDGTHSAALIAGAGRPFNVQIGCGRRDADEIPAS